MLRPGVLVMVSVAACGQPGSTPVDVPPATEDAVIDAGTDATDAGMDGGPGLTPDPSEPASLPCPGVIGFPSTFSFETNGSRMVRVADFDGDGRDDLITLESTFIVVHRAVGDGTFERVASVSTTNSDDLQVVDLNGDGAVDLVFEDTQITRGVVNNRVRVALNDGNGGLGTPQIIPVPKTVNQIEVADLDGDGDLDIVTLTSLDDIVVLLQSNGSFASSQSYSANARFMAVADVTGDGRPELVVTNGNVGVLVNAGNGTFGAPVMVAAPANAQGVLVTDVNEDGVRDIVVGTKPVTGPQASVLLNQGNGTFGPAANTPLDAFEAPTHIAATDVNGDGHVDIATGGTGSDRAQILLGTGTGQFGVERQLVHTRPFAVAFGNFDADGRPDLAIFSLFTGTVLLNTGTVDVYETRTVDTYGFVPSEGAGVVRLLDLDDDGRLDLVGMVPIQISRRLVWRLATGDSFGVTSSLEIASKFTRLFTADLDNDGRQDLVLFGGGIRAMLNNGDGTFTPSTELVFQDSPNFLAIGDVSGDGKRDVVVGRLFGNGASEVTVHAGTGDGSFAAGTMIWSGTFLTGIAIADLNGDGTADVAISSRFGQGQRHEVLLAAGGGTFSAPLENTYVGLFLSSLFARDLNGDGNIDLGGFVHPDGLAVALGNGDGTFGIPLQSPARSGPNKELVAFADVNGDGHLDLLARMPGPVSVLPGRGDGTFASQRFFETRGSGHFAIADLDNDGRVDIVADDPDGFTILPGRCW